MIDEVILNRIFFIIIIILIALLYFSIDENAKLTDFFSRTKDALKKTKIDFKTETVAVCENTPEGKNCYDVVFVTCAGTKHRIIDVNGSIVLEKNWQGQR